MTMSQPKRIDFLGYSMRGSYKQLFCNDYPLYGRICLTIAYRFRFCEASL